ncbi:hypothetical protein WJX74_007146 [Apatococcus lobatus]|uniref:Uncharacterized protein n=1 Tax=Apatococcus lobatus TaxID=904363 RepID=A0AAW1RLX2_9CHLO
MHLCKGKQTTPTKGGRTPKIIHKWESLDAEVDEIVKRHDMEKCLSATRGPRPLRRIYGTAANPSPVDHEEELYPSIVLGVYAAANLACKALGLSAVFGSSRAGANTQCDLRCLTDTAAGGQRTIIPHEVKLATHTGNGIHYAAAANGKDRDAVRLPLAQVEEGATYAILSTKVRYTFLKRGLGPSELYISRTYNAEEEPVGPILVALAAKALSEPARPLSTYLDTPPDQTLTQPRRSKSATTASAAAQTGNRKPGPEDPDDPRGDTAGKGPASNPTPASVPPSQGRCSQGKRPAASAGQNTHKKQRGLSGLPNAASRASPEQTVPPHQSQSPAAAPARGTRPDTITDSAGGEPACSSALAGVEDAYKMPDYPRHALDIGRAFYHGDGMW